MGKTETKSVYLVWEHLRFSTCSISIILATCEMHHTVVARLLTWSRNKGKSAAKIHHQKKGEGFSLPHRRNWSTAWLVCQLKRRNVLLFVHFQDFIWSFSAQGFTKAKRQLGHENNTFENHGLYLFQFQGQKWPIISDFNLSGRKINKKCEKKSLQQQVWSFWIWQFPISQVKRFKIETFVENQSTRQGHVPTHVNSMSFPHCPPSGPIFGCLANDTMQPRTVHPESNGNCK